MSYQITISPKDTTAKLVLKNVEFYWQEGNMWCCLTDGRIRNYPLTHIWYVEIAPEVPPCKTK